MENASYKKETQMSRFTNTVQNLKRINQMDTSQSDQLQKFTFKKEIYRAIINNDISKIIGQSQDSKEQRSFFPENTTNKQIHKYLIEIRKKYDEIKSKTTHKQKEIQSTKLQVENLKQKAQTIRKNISSKREELTQTQIQMKNMVENSETSSYTKDVYIHIYNNTKADNQIIKKVIFDRENQFSRILNKIKIISTDAINKRKTSQKFERMLNSVQQVVQNEKVRRLAQLTSFNSITNKMQQTFLKKEIREKKSEMMISSAMHEKIPQQKEWLKVFQANFLLSKILRNKIQRELQKNTEIQNAFQKIKVNTGVSHCDDFVQKFLNRQLNYGNLLNSISQKQSKLEKLQLQNQLLKKQLKELSENQSYYDENSTQLQQSNGVFQQKNELQKKLENVSKKRIIMQKQQEAFYQYLVKFLKKYDAINLERPTTTIMSNKNKRKGGSYYQIYPRQKLGEIYKKVEKILIDILTQSDQKEDPIQEILNKTRISDFGQSERFLERNTRINTNVEQVPQKIQKNTIQMSDLKSESEYLDDLRKHFKKQDRQRRFSIKTKPF